MWADFVHDTDEIVMVVAGDVEFEIEGKTHRPEPGEELLIPAGASHTVRNVGNTESRWLYGYRGGWAPGFALNGAGAEAFRNAPRRIGRATPE